MKIQLKVNMEFEFSDSLLAARPTLVIDTIRLFINRLRNTPYVRAVTVNQEVIK